MEGYESLEEGEIPSPPPAPKISISDYDQTASTRSYESTRPKKRCRRNRGKIKKIGKKSFAEDFDLMRTKCLERLKATKAKLEKEKACEEIKATEIDEVVMVDANIITLGDSEEEEIKNLRQLALSSQRSHRTSDEDETDKTENEFSLRAEALKTAILKKRPSILRKKHKVRSQSQLLKNSNDNFKNMSANLVNNEENRNDLVDIDFNVGKENVDSSEVNDEELLRQQLLASIKGSTTAMSPKVNNSPLVAEESTDKSATQSSTKLSRPPPPANCSKDIPVINLSPIKSPPPPPSIPLDVKSLQQRYMNSVDVNTIVKSLPEKVDKINDIHVSTMNSPVPCNRTDVMSLSQATSVNKINNVHANSTNSVVPSVEAGVKSFSQGTIGDMINVDVENNADLTNNTLVKSLSKSTSLDRTNNIDINFMNNMVPMNNADVKSLCDGMIRDTINYSDLNPKHNSDPIKNGMVNVEVPMNRADVKSLSNGTGADKTNKDKSKNIPINKNNMPSRSTLDVKTKNSTASIIKTDVKSFVERPISDKLHNIDVNGTVINTVGVKPSPPLNLIKTIGIKKNVAIAANRRSLPKKSTLIKNNLKSGMMSTFKTDVKKDVIKSGITVMLPRQADERIVVNLGQDSSDDDEPKPTPALTPGTLMNSIDDFLSNARRQVESSVPSTPEAVYAHLPPSQRMEYIKLKKQLAEKEQNLKLKKTPSDIEQPTSVSAPPVVGNPTQVPEKCITNTNQVIKLKEKIDPKLDVNKVAKVINNVKHVRLKPSEQLKAKVSEQKLTRNLNASLIKNSVKQNSKISTNLTSATQLMSLLKREVVLEKNCCDEVARLRVQLNCAEQKRKVHATRVSLLRSRIKGLLEPTAKSTEPSGGFVKLTESASEKSAETSSGSSRSAPNSPLSKKRKIQGNLNDYESPLGNIESGLNPLVELCPHDLNGKCRDPECQYQHMPAAQTIRNGTV